MGEEGEGLFEHLAKKYGSSAAKNFVNPNSNMAQMGRAVGIEWNHDRKMYNTKKVHALIEHVKSKDSEKANRLMELMYARYFEEGCDLSDTNELASYAKKVGFEEDEARSAMADGKQKEILKKDRSIKSQFGVSGVPFFIIDQINGDDPITFSGAYPVDFIAEQLKAAAASD